MNKLLILDIDPEAYASEVVQRGLRDLNVIPCADISKTQDILSDVNIILGQPRRIVKALESTPNVAWVQSTFAGIEPFCQPGIRTDYILTGVKNVFGPLMREFVFAYIFALERSLFETFENQRAARWKPIPYRSIAGLTLGVCGLGSIGCRIAETASHFGMRVFGLNRSADPVEQVERVYGCSELHEFVSELDYLVIALPHTSDTHHLIDGAVFSNMKDTAVLINVGRGSTVQEEDLIASLQNGSIRAAVLDVFEQEPLPETSPLWKMDNVIITPHNSAFSFPSQIVDIFQENYLRFVENLPLKYVIDLAREY